MGQACINCFAETPVTVQEELNPGGAKRINPAMATSNSTNASEMDGYMTGAIQTTHASLGKTDPNYSSQDIGIEDFQIIKVIGRGSFGKVYLVQKKDDGNIYAMKSLKKDMVLRKGQTTNTRVERMILERINHPFIVKLHYAFQTPERLYFVIDFLNGGELFFHLRKETRFNQMRARFYAAEIILALECLHGNGVIYRDLKPENVILDSDGHIKLTDFGLSKLQVTGDKMTYTFCGTPEYLAPEIVQGTGHNQAVDWWSLGLMIYEMLSGINPFKIKNKNKFEKLQMITDRDIEMRPDFSDEATSLLRGLLKRNPRERLGSHGVEDIKRHIFFDGVDWQALYARQVDTPFVPEIANEMDLRNIDKMFTKERPSETPEVSMLLQKKKFEQFTYVENQSALN